MNKIYIHIIIKNLLEAIDTKNNIIRNINTKNISFVWFLINSVEDIDKFIEVGNLFIPEPVIFVKKLSLINNIPINNIKNIVIPINSDFNLSELENYREIMDRYKPNIYLKWVETSKREDKNKNLKVDCKTVYEKIKQIVGFLKNLNIHPIYANFNTHDFPTTVNMQKIINRDLKTPTLISFRKLDNENETALINSLTLGNLFYENPGSSVLLEYETWADFNKIYDDNIRLIKTILGSLGLVKTGYTIISCPKCGRCQMDLLNINREVDKYLSKLEEDYNRKGINLEDMGGITVAVMGCNVNGPGEARGADIGIAGGKNGLGTIFKYGIPFETLPEEKVVGEFLHHIKTLIDKKIKDAGIKNTV